MKHQTISCAREELYEQVWSQPMTKLAKTYGLSDNGLRKICKKYNIPLPKIGYWQKLQYGKYVKQKPLLDSNREEEIIICGVEKEETLIDTKEYCKIQNRIAFEQLPENQIKVSKKLLNPHPLIIQIRKGVDILPTDKGLVICRRKGLDISVSPNNLNRALRIMDALIKALKVRGINVSLNPNEKGYLTCVNIFGEDIEICLTESLKRIKLPEKKKRKFFFLDEQQYDYKSTGHFALKIKDGPYYIRKKWGDGQNQKVEDCLNSFIIGLYKVVLKEKSRRFEWEKKRKAEEEEKRKHEEKARLRLEEQEKLNALENQAVSWQKSQLIRLYIEAAKKTHLKENGSIIQGSEFEKWLNWANQQADRIDPLIKTPPSILDEKGKIHATTKTSFPPYGVAPLPIFSHTSPR